MMGICYMIQIKIKQEGEASEFYIILFMACNSILAFEWDIIKMPKNLMMPTR